MRNAGIYSEFSNWVWVKNAGSTHKTHKTTPAPWHFQMLGAHKQCPRCMAAFFYFQGAWLGFTMPKAHAFSSLVQLLCILSFLGLRLQITCLGTWKQNSSLCKVSWDLLNLHCWSSQSLDNSSDVLALPICMISSWITSKTPKIPMFREN